MRKFPSKNWGGDGSAWGPLKIHVSFDGSTAVACGGGWAGIELASLKGNKVTRVQAGGYVNGDTTVAGNGSFGLSDEGGIIRADLTSKVSGIDGKPVPAADPSFSLAYRKDAGKSSLIFFANADPRPLVNAPRPAGTGSGFEASSVAKSSVDSRRQSMITVGEGATSLVVRSFDLAKELWAEGIDYLFVESSPICKQIVGSGIATK